MQVGPLLVALILDSTGSLRWGVLSSIVFAAAGMPMLDRAATAVTTAPSTIVVPTFYICSDIRRLRFDLQKGKDERDLFEAALKLKARQDKQVPTYLDVSTISAHHDGSTPASTAHHHVSISEDE
eukprot:1187545-Prorocentrum_minimum.AAC.1